MTYEYGCSTCQFKFESQQRITDRPHLKCPECGTLSLQRLVSGGAAVILKGGGWAKDGYGSSATGDDE